MMEWYQNGNSEHTEGIKNVPVRTIQMLTSAYNKYIAETRAVETEIKDQVFKASEE